ncbi:hypothetical protein [Arthrobacter sp. ok362]|uniref:hypothetical protein n=1 Tax=Arthrobacter sp. ok362 TaxID=1761745 RepID=UPI000881F274|nr:hypothetical protein [Arthrobacter sp. ok362]SDL30657.1 hypothetical protein SAMN04487913_10831 [Arthrobacter sp. ok362]
MVGTHRGYQDEALTSLHSWRPAVELRAAEPLRHGPGSPLRGGTSWSAVHGDARSGNIINTGDSEVLFDFDKVCWAPSVWVLSHLLNRAGTPGNTGYTADEITAMFPFTATEVAAALQLRRVAAVIAKAHREHLAPIPVTGRGVGPRLARIGRPITHGAVVARASRSSIVDSTLPKAGCAAASDAWCRAFNDSMSPSSMPGVAGSGSVAKRKTPRLTTRSPSERIAA